MKKKLDKLNEWAKVNGDEFMRKVNGFCSLIVLGCSIALSLQGQYEPAIFGALVALYGQQQYKK